MKLPKIRKTRKLDLIFNIGKSYMILLPENSSLLRNIPKLTDLAMDRKNNFQDQNRLQIELQHLSDLLLELETQVVKEKKVI